MKLVLIYYQSREEYQCAQITLPIYYSSKEEAAADFEAVYLKPKQYDFRFAGHRFNYWDFRCDGEFRPPDIYTIEEWFKLENSEKYETP